MPHRPQVGNPWYREMAAMQLKRVKKHSFKPLASKLIQLSFLITNENMPVLIGFKVIIVKMLRKL